jgi:hypothetical protein
MGYASPSRIVAAEVAFARLAQRKGQWAASRDTATEDAVLFTPGPVTARDWLKARKSLDAVTRQPHQIWMSCDGSLAVSYGAAKWTDGSQGYFTTVWQRQKDGEYKWVMDQGDRLATPLEAPEMIGSRIAACKRTVPATTAAAPARPPAAIRPAPRFAGGARGWSDDRTLSWIVQVDATCGRALTVTLGAQEQVETVLQKQVASPITDGAQRTASCSLS